MKQQVRELLVTTKTAQNWKGQFEKNVDDLMEIVNKIDTEKNILEAGETLDVYHKTRQKPKARKKKLTDSSDKPFEFFVFRN